MTTQSHFDPSEALSSDFGIFGLPLREEDAEVILLPVPWEVTTSYGRGAADGPLLIRNASEQVDLFDLETGKAYEKGFFMRDYPENLRQKNDLFKSKAQRIIHLRTHRLHSAHPEKDIREIESLTQEVNTACSEMNEWVYQQTKNILSKKKKFALVGGDHSTPFGAIKAFCEQYDSQFGILHIDAHADLREAYQGFQFSHASIMNNVMNLPNPPKKLVQVGIRDFCEEEYIMSRDRKDIQTFYDLDVQRQKLEGKSWQNLCGEILKELPEKVYISFDVDGLQPTLCPHTGTPVPGGLQVEEVFYLFRLLKESGRTLIGFDLNEVSSGGEDLSAAEWDGNVGARILYKLCSWLALS
jgi:agmatinase